MFFKQPQILWFLLALAIPIIVHLFQLRRFKPEFFTNVRFLKNLLSQTRKSSQLKKYLLLATRLALILAIVMLFAQPFLKAKDSQFAQNELVFVVDNSLSMQAKGEAGELFKRTLEDILTQVPEDVTFSLYTNDEALHDLSTKTSQREIQDLPYSSQPFSLDKIFLRLSGHNKQNAKDVIVFTDNKNLKWPKLNTDNSNLKFFSKILKSQDNQNCSIDSVYMTKVSDNFYDLTIKLSKFGDFNQKLPVSLYNNNKLIAKSLVDLNKVKEINFTIQKEQFNGYVAIDDKSLAFDNKYFFSIKNFQKSKVLSIGNSANQAFLNRIYNPSEFDFITTENINIEAQTLEQSSFIVLNELQQLPLQMIENVKNYIENGGSLVFIPSLNAAVDSYNKLFEPFGLRYADYETGELKITKIAQQHPLFKGVFEKQISNFQYPSVTGHYAINSSFPTIFHLENGAPFLSTIPTKSGQIYVFSTPLSRQNSSFIETPLIVPTFYNMAKMNNNSDLTALILGDMQSFIVEAKNEINQVLTVKNETETFIPLQQILSNKVKLNFIDHPTKAGNFEIISNNKIVQPISFNYNRSESNVTVASSNLPDDVTAIDSIAELLDNFNSDRTTSDLWRWFLLLAILLILAEILIQKYVK
jgi:hypothetical protein